MFLVGGPTLMPYIKGRLESELINRLEFSIDPFTVVAQGAALTASRIRMAEVIPPVRPDETYALNLQFSPSGPGAEFRVEGQVEAPEKGTVLNGFTLIARREPGGSTTRVIVNPDGRFTDYLAVETGENIFILELLNEQGVSQAIAAAEQRLKRTRDDEMPPPTAPNIPISRSIGVVLSDDSFDRVLIRGRDSHPANVTRAYVTTVGVEPGTADRIIHIPIMEGERTRGDRNRQIGFINISAEELRRTLPAGTHVQVTIRLESSGQSWVEAFVPVVGQRFKAELKLIIQAPDLSTLKDEYEAEMKRSDELMDQIKELAGNDPTEADRGRKVKDELETMEGRMSELRLRAQTQGEALQQLEPALLEFQAQTDELEAISDWLALIVAQQKNVDFMQSEVDSAGTPEDKQKAKTIQLRMQQALKGKKAEELKKVGADANTLGSNIYFRSPKNWERHFNKLKRDFEARPEDYANQQKIKEILASASPNGNAGSFRDSVIDLETTMDVNPPPPGSKVGSTVKRA
jgi:molecular chaperone DnaK